MSLYSRFASTALISAALLTATAALPALAAGFSEFNGSWSGTGTVHPQGGSPERIRCNATYQPQGDNNLNVHIRCASDSYNFDLSGQLSTDGTSIRGQWTENSRGVGGTASGTVRGDRMQVHVEGSGFSADMGISTRGRRQDVTMESHAAGEIVRGNIGMNRH